MADGKLASFDLETHLIIPGNAAPKIVCGSMALPENPDKGQLLYPEEAIAFVENWLLGEGALVGANLPYDMGCIAVARPDLLPLIFRAYEEGRLLDVHVSQALRDIGHGTLFRDAQGAKIHRYSLKNIAEKTLGIVIEKENTWRLRYGELDGVPHEQWPAEAKQYPKDDAKYPLMIRKAQFTGQPGDPGVLNLALEKYENRANWALRLMSLWGPRTDPEMVVDVVQSVTQKHEEAQARFGEAGIYRLEGWCRREKQCEGRPPHKLTPGCWKPWLPSKIGTRDGEVLKGLVSAAYQGKPPCTATGEVSTDRDTLIESEDELLALLAEAGPNEKELSTYLQVIESGTKVPINVEYNVIVKTCRCSARNPNLQNLPRGGRTRECFVPRDFRHPDPMVRKVFCSVDYPSLELVTLAETTLTLFGSSTLADLLNADVDLHIKLASMLERVPYEEALARRKAHDKRMEDLRQAAKPVNYGMGGGMSDEALVLYCRQPSNGGVKFCLLEGAPKCGLKKILGTKGKAEGKPICAACLEVARKFRAAWFEMLGEMEDYFALVKKEVGKDPSGSLVPVTVREGEPVLWCAGRSFNAGANLKFQGLAGRLAKDAIWRQAKACYVEEDSPMFGCRPAIFIHDEGVTEMPELISHTAAFEMARIFREAAKYWCPRVKCEPKPALMRRLFKKAEDVYMPQKQLIPWWPKSWDWALDKEIMEYDLKRKAA